MSRLRRPDVKKVKKKNKNMQLQLQLQLRLAEGTGWKKTKAGVTAGGRHHQRASPLLFLPLNHFLPTIWVLVGLWWNLAYGWGFHGHMEAVLEQDPSEEQMAQSAKPEQVSVSLVSLPLRPLPSVYVYIQKGLRTVRACDKQTAVYARLIVTVLNTDTTGHTRCCCFVHRST